jgi:peptidoglycan-associated lipoprotein
MLKSKKGSIMKLKKWMQVAVIGAGFIMLAACSSAHKRDGSIDAANAAYNDGAQASGLGSESNFGDANSRSALAKRTYYFDYNSNAVHDSDKPSIYANANYIMAHPRLRVAVEGNTDPRGSREYNIALGERRARAVAALLQSKGVNPAQLRIISYGAEKPAVPGHTEAAYQQDRRVVLAYM